MLEKVDQDIIDLINRVLTSLGDTSKVGLEEIAKIHYADGIGAMAAGITLLVVSLVVGTLTYLNGSKLSADAKVPAYIVAVVALVLCILVVPCHMKNILAPEGLAVRELIQLCR
jgi:hypothetical protein